MAEAVVGEPRLRVEVLLLVQEGDEADLTYL